MNEVAEAQQKQKQTQSSAINHTHHNGDNSTLSNLNLNGKAWYFHPIKIMDLSFKKHLIIILNNKSYKLDFLYQRENMEMLTDFDYELVASELQCEAKALKAVGIKKLKIKVIILI